MGDWAVADCEEVRTPWLALSGPRTVFILNENFFSRDTRFPPTLFSKHVTTMRSTC